jgi:hypothetical protein
MVAVPEPGLGQIFAQLVGGQSTRLILDFTEHVRDILV